MYCKTNEVIPNWCYVNMYSAQGRVKEKGMHRAMEVLYAVKKVNISDEVQIQHRKMLVDNQATVKIRIF